MILQEYIKRILQNGIDTREKVPFDFSRFRNWIAGELRQ
jgi:hypothetical protein